MKWLVALFLTQPVYAEFNPVPTGDVKTDQNLRSVVEEMKRIETSVTTTTWLNASVIISTTPGASGQGVQFQDGTIQYTATPSAFISTITVGAPLVYTTTATYAAVVNGACADVVKSSFTTASTIYITNISSAAYEHYMTIISSKATTGEIKLTVNSDGGSNYYHASYGINTSVVAVSNGGNTAFFDPIACYSTTPQVLDGTTFAAHYKICNMPKISNDVIFLGSSNFQYGVIGTSSVTCLQLTAKYKGSAPMTTMTITNSAGTMTGWLTIKACPSGLSP